MLGAKKWRKTQWLLIVGHRGWTAQRLDSPDASPLEGSETPRDPEVLGAPIATAIGGQGPAEIVLALQGTVCWSGAFTIPHTKQRRNRQALAYQFEEHTPVAAEEMLADYVVDGREVFAVGCDQKLVAKLIEALAQEQITVACLTPAVLLAGKKCTGKNAPRQSVLVWTHPSENELVGFGNGKPTWWRVTAPGQELLQQALQAEQLIRGELGETTFVAGVDSSSVENDKESCLASMVDSAHKILRGDATPVIDLSRDLAHGDLRTPEPLRPDRTLLELAAILLLAMVSLWGWRTSTAADRAAEQASAAQVEVFRTLFPDKRIPTGMLSRLKSELRRKRGLQGEEGKLPRRTSAIALLQNVLNGLPQEMRYRVLEIRITGGKLYLQGEARQHGDADRIARALAGERLRVAAPTTQQLADVGVEFRLTAIRGATSRGTTSRGGNREKK